ncbi:MAG: phosphoribosyltransferase family protein [Erythrobacter sp.]|uniref:phosphoribosyltransferase n=1 Tax=Erythrobacter sp. TaxID=1042 RepID=UPI003265DE77
MIKKTFLSADDLLEDSFALGDAIIESGFHPTHIVAIWRGGAPIGIAVQELLEYRGHPCDHIAVRTSSYTGIDQQHKEVRVLGLNYLIDNLDRDHSLLIIDDVFDSGRSIEALLRELSLKCRRNLPKTIKVATVYYKPSRNQTDLTPDYFVHETDDWLVFPHELQGLTPQEINEHKSSASVVLGKD